MLRDTDARAARWRAFTKANAQRDAASLETLDFGVFGLPRFSGCFPVFPPFADNAPYGDSHWAGFKRAVDGQRR